LSASEKQHLATLKDRLDRMKRGEVWGSDNLGRYTTEENAKEIAHLKLLITSVEAGDV